MPLTEAEKKQILSDRGLDPDKFEVYDPTEQLSKSPEAPPAPQSSALGSFGRAAGRGLVPSLGAAIGGTLPAWLLGPEVGLPVTIGATLLGGGLGAIGAEKAQEAALSQFAPTLKASMDQQAAIDAASHPLAQTLGGVASALPTFEFAPGQAFKGIGAAYRLGRGLVPEAEQAAARAMAYGTGAQLGLGAASGAINPLLEGRTPTAEDIGMGVGQAALLGRHRGWLGSVPGLGFMAHPNIPRGTLEPSLTPGSNFDQPIGPEEPLNSRIDKALQIGQDSALTRLYRAKYGQPTTEKVPLGIGISESTPVSDVSESVPHILIPSMGGEVSLPLHPPEPAKDVPSPAKRETRQPSAMIEGQPEGAHILLQKDPTTGNLVIVEEPAVQIAGATTTQPKVETKGFFTKPNPLQTAAEKAMRPEPRTGKVYSSASPENIAATQAAALERNNKYASQPIVEQKPPDTGVQPRPNLPENKAKVRGQKGKQTSGGGGLRAKTEEQAHAIALVNEVTESNDHEQLHGAQIQGKGAQAGIPLDASHVPALEKQAQHLEKMGIDDIENGDEKSYRLNSAKAMWLRGVIEGAKKEGANYEGVLSGELRPNRITTPPVTENEPGLIGKLAGKGEPPVVSGPADINAKLNAILAKQGGDPNVKFQEASKTAAELPAEDLLSHPVNADMLEFTKKVAERHSVEVKETDEPITTPEGALAAGSAEISKRIARFNGSLATIDTGLHEIGHIFLDDARTSPDPVARKLYNDGVQVFNGSEEALTQAMGLRASELGKARIEGNTLRRFKLWAKDFWSWVKDKFGQATAEDLKNLLARRMVDGELVARGERLPISNEPVEIVQIPSLATSAFKEGDRINFGSNLHGTVARVLGDGLLVQRDDGSRIRITSSTIIPVTDELGRNIDIKYQAARTKETTKDVESRDITLPGLRSIGETVKRLPIFGEHLFNKWFTPFYETRDRMLGKYRNEANHILSQLDPWWKPNKVNADAVAQRLFAERENPNYTPTEMAPQVEAAYRQVKDLLESAAKEANERGIRVMDGDDFREIIINRRYIPHMMSEEASYIISNKQGSPEYNALKKDYVDWVMRGGLKGAANGVSEDVANSMWKDRTSGSTSVITKGTGGFGPLEMAAGMGLPPSMREQRLSNVLNRYFDRYAEKIAWFESVEKDTPENAITRSLLNQTDQLGSRDKNATELEDGQPIVNVASKPEIEHAIKDMLRNYDRADRVVEAFNRGVKALMMQTMTGFADFTGGIFNSAQHLGLMDYLTLTPKAVTNIAKGIAAGRRWNVVQEHAARLQSGSIEGAGYGAPMGNRVDNMVKWANAAADGIYKITGRDAFERWGRGLLMNLGMLKTEATIGRIRIGRATSADLKWMDTFVGRDKWESMLAQGKDAVTTELQENIAAKFVQSVQGTYDARGLPHWALSGQLSPFFALARWNIEKANNFTKYVINPMRKGDFAPFLKMTLGAAVGGEVIHLFRQMLTDRKPQDANWSEIMAAGGAGLDYRLLASMAYTGYAGAMADVLKQAWDIGHGNQPQGFRFPVVSAISGAANRGAQFAQAIENGENPFELLPQLAVTLGKDNIQMARALTRFASEDEQQQINQSNSLRDLKVYRQAQGIPVPPSIGQQANPFLSPLKRQFQSASLPQAIQLAPQLIAQAIARSSGDPERLRALMRNYAAPSANVMPSLQTQPFQFKQYVDWLRATQGPAAAQQAVSSYFQKQAEDQVKRALVPSF